MLKENTNSGDREMVFQEKNKKSSSNESKSSSSGETKAGSNELLEENDKKNNSKINDEQNDQTQTQNQVLVNQGSSYNMEVEEDVLKNSEEIEKKRKEQRYDELKKIYTLNQSEEMKEKMKRNHLRQKMRILLKMIERILFTKNKEFLQFMVKSIPKSIPKLIEIFMELTNQLAEHVKKTELDYYDPDCDMFFIHPEESEYRKFIKLFCKTADLYFDRNQQSVNYQQFYSWVMEAKNLMIPDDQMDYRIPEEQDLDEKQKSPKILIVLKVKEDFSSSKLNNNNKEDQQPSKSYKDSEEMKTNKLLSEEKQEDKKNQIVNEPILQMKRNNENNKEFHVFYKTFKKIINLNLSLVLQTREHWFPYKNESFKHLDELMKQELQLMNLIQMNSDHPEYKSFIENMFDYSYSTKYINSFMNSYDYDDVNKNNLKFTLITFSSPTTFSKLRQEIITFIDTTKQVQMEYNN